MATRRQRRARQLGRRLPIGKCEAEGCPKDAVTEVFIPDSGRHHRLCGAHAGAVERQIRRNEEHARGETRKATEERLGLR